MKPLKKIVRGILTLFLIGCIGLLFLSMHLENMLGSIIKETMKTQLSTPITTLLKDQKLIEDQVKDEDIANIILEDEQVNQLYNQYSDTILKGITDEKELESLDLSNSISTIIRNHKEELQEKLHVAITDEQIDAFSKEVSSSPHIKEKIVDTVKSMKNQLSHEEQELLNSYRFIISNNFRLLLSSLILFLILLIAILYPSTYRWIFNTALAVAITSILNFIFLPIFKSIVDYYFQEQLNILAEIKIKVEITHTTWLLAIGILMFIIYYIINYVIKKNHETT